MDKRTRILLVQLVVHTEHNYVIAKLAFSVKKRQPPYFLIYNMLQKNEEIETGFFLSFFVANTCG